ncbi:MAG TPA: prenyltransferase/squalene oxidase repeat-containing protein [Casimicrobiaceae bacterium]|nr:prenyltransferase/squalene oxidase repeat-containing protein [Casimicrobiaceae bacterium]
MNFRELLAVPFRYAPWRPRHARLIALDLVGSVEPEHPSDDHLRGAIDWLCRAQDVRDRQADAGGVSAGWSFEDGWLPSYPETSGYIVETFLAAAEALKRPQLTERARRILDWELSIQRPDGAFPGHFGEPGSQPVVFNTGQIMHGMLAGYLQLHRSDCLEAAVRAGAWLARVQDSDGCWRQFEHHDTPHTYNTRATWALLATALVARDGALEAAAIRNLEWARAQQRESGWFAHNAFVPDRAPYTHTIAYAIRGFLEAGALLDSETYLGVALKAARALARAQRADGWLAGTYDPEWKPAARYCCLTGVAQMSVNWMRCAQITGSAELSPHARLALRFVKRRQRLADRDAAARGAIAGSAPLWGDYSRFEFPNWATKFFADALMMERSGMPVPPVPATLRHETVAHV